MNKNTKTLYTVISKKKKGNKRKEMYVQRSELFNLALSNQTKMAYNSEKCGICNRV